MTLSLPWPPSVNRYWRRVGNKTILSADARAYRGQVLACTAEQHAARHAGQRLAVQIVAYPPDRRARDLDNLPKGILDSLHITRRSPARPGRVEVTVSVLP